MDYNKSTTINKQLLNPQLIINELRIRKDQTSAIFHKLLSCSSESFDDSWHPILQEILEIIGTDPDVQNQQILLASQIFFIISGTSVLTNDLQDLIKIIFNLNDRKFVIYNREIVVNNLEPFKLIIIHGYLTVKNEILYSADLYSTILPLISNHCRLYTKYSYFSFKLLEKWLNRTVHSPYWKSNDPSIEKELEIIIFSNWDNSINEIPKINSTQVFSLYLQMMSEKYPTFLEYTFRECRHLSWQCGNKFIILAEIVNRWDGLPQFKNKDWQIILRSLEKNHLKHPLTVLYLALLDKMELEDWTLAFGNLFESVVVVWEKENKLIPLEIFWDLWMKPTIKKYKASVILSLWATFALEGAPVCQSYLFKYAKKLGMSWKDLNSSTKSLEECKEDRRSAIKDPKETSYSDDLSFIRSIIDDKREIVSMNAFAAYCLVFPGSCEQHDLYSFSGRYLYFNANASSMHIRKGIYDNFEMLFSKMIKSRSDENCKFICWLQDFILDCFEPGSCYQRKIVGLNLYEIVLSYTNCSVGQSKRKRLKKDEMSTRNGPLMKETLLSKNMWVLEDKSSLFILLKLCLDKFEETRNISSRIIINYFNLSILTAEEVNILMDKLAEMNKSSNFYEIAGGVKLLSVLTSNPHPETASLRENLLQSLINDAEKSLVSLKSNFLKSLVDGTSFNSSLVAVFEIGFKNTFVETLVNEDVLEKLLGILEEATGVFLTTLTPESSDTLYSSSFAEMGMAVQEIIEKSEINSCEFDSTMMTPAHQLIISYIWMGLKILCELSAKLSTLEIGFNYRKRLLDVIVSVLMKCRHKGAIESAGTALGLAMQTLSSKEEFNPVFDYHLDKLLNLDSKDHINTTRRGAGLSIMFHKMMVHDDRKTRRLLNYAVKRLIFLLNNPLADSSGEKKNDQDCPQARQLHFLNKIVADSSLSANLAPFVEEISLICFKHLQSSEWAIRNGSLQLLGSLIPRLVGQSSEGNLDFANGYFINHFVIHYPNLSHFILENLRKESSFKIDGNVVPILTLISKMSVGGCDFTDLNSYSYITQMKDIIYKLFEHPVDHVRYLSAKSYAALTFPKDILSNIINLKLQITNNKNRNFIHGNLLAQMSLYLLLQNGIQFQLISGKDREMYQIASEIDVFLLKQMLIRLDDQRKDETNISSFIIESTLMGNILTHQNASSTSEIKLAVDNLQSILTNLQSKDIGASEFIDRILQLNSKCISNVKSCISLCKSEISPEIKRFAIKNFDCKRFRNDKVDGIDESFSLLLSLLALPTSNERDSIDESYVIEQADLILRILNCKEEDRKDYLTREGNALANLILEFGKMMLEEFRSQRVYRLAYKLLSFVVFDDCHKSSSIKQRFIDYIKDSAYNNDENEKINAIECLTVLKLMHREIFALEFSIILLNDENADIRKVLCEKHAKFNWFSLRADEPSKLPQIFLHQLIDWIVNAHSSYHPGSSLKKAIHRILGYEGTSLAMKKSNLESPYDHDQVYRENTKIINIFYHYIYKIYNNFNYNCDDDYKSIITTGKLFYKDYYKHNLFHVLSKKSVDYLLFKQKSVDNFIYSRSK